MKSKAAALAVAQQLADGLCEPYAVLRTDRNRYAVEAQSFLASDMGRRRYGNREREWVLPAVQEAPTRSRG